MNHLRYSGLGEDRQRAVLDELIRTEPLLMEVLEGLRELALPDGWLVSGAIYNNVWNRLTGRPPMTGVKDIDIIYFNDSDLSYEAEDVVIQRADKRFEGLPVPVEVRNQARVHLWYPDRFGVEIDPFTSSLDSLDRYASVTHAVAAQLLDDDALQIAAPFGLDEMFSFRIVPNPATANKSTHNEKGARARSVWPEVSVVPWPAD